ncbi:MAG: hypothetical protein LC772_01090 [Chloroflexi bacterium]|nr:hypothetical protein [Chloroflexota bacterium]
MPVLNEERMETRSIPNGHYGYSATRLEDLGASEYTLVTIVNDVSGSVAAFAGAMEKALGSIVQACKMSPRANNLLLRLVTFSDRLGEVHGFKLLDQCRPSDYAGILSPNGSTALYDAAENAVAAAAAQGRQMKEAGYSVNGIVFVMTDGADNASRLAIPQLRHTLEQAVRDGGLESLVSVLIGVNVRDRVISDYLNRLHADAGFTQYIELERADPRILARLADFLSRSISAQSQSLGTGGPSRSLTF